jgi:hypothetical protein
LTFAGELFGYLTFTNAHIESYYPGVTTKSLTIGKDLYTVHLATFAPSGPDCTTAQVTATATVTVQAMPEPSAGILAGLGLPAVILLLQRRQRRVSRPVAGRTSNKMH